MSPTCRITYKHHTFSWKSFEVFSCGTVWYNIYHNAIRNCCSIDLLTNTHTCGTASRIDKFWDQNSVLEKIILEVLFQEPCHGICDDSAYGEYRSTQTNKPLPEEMKRPEGKLKAKVDSPFLLRRWKDKWQLKVTFQQQIIYFKIAL